MTPLILIPMLALAAQDEARVPKHLDLFVGAEVVLEARPTKASMGDAKIADLKVVGDDQLMVIGVSEGETVLKLWRSGRDAPDEITIRVGRKPTRDTTPDEVLALKVGAQKTLTLAGMMRVAVGDPQICEVKTIGNNQLLITAGTHEGDTTLLIWSTGGARKSFLVHVTH